MSTPSPSSLPPLVPHPPVFVSTVVACIAHDNHVLEEGDVGLEHAGGAVLGARRAPAAVTGGGGSGTGSVRGVMGVKAPKASQTG